MENAEIERGLMAARHGLLSVGFCGPSDHGIGDLEVRAIDAALAIIRTQRRLEKLGKLGFEDAANLAANAEK